MGLVRLPFINKYPYTSFEAVNIDWLLNQVAKIPVLEEKVNQHETRIGTLEETAADHEQRIQEAEADIDSLEGRMDAAEGEIDQLQDDIGTAKNDITDLKGRVSTAEGDIDSLEGRMDTAEGEIDQLQADVGNIQIKDQAQDNDILGLDGRVTDLEENVVVANPGGTGSNLNSIGISGVTYLIPSGGGGGGGSSITPNPSGTATGTLIKIDIDGSIYDIPDSRAEVSALQDAVDELEEAVLDIDTRIGTVIQKTRPTISIAPAISTGEVIELTSANVGTDMGILLPPGVYQVSFSCDFDTTNYGSTPRFLGGYIRDALHTNLARDKFSVFGTERAMITQAASVQCTTVITVTGTGMQLWPAIRCNSSRSNTGFAITDVEFTAVRLGVVS